MIAAAVAVTAAVAAHKSVFLLSISTMIDDEQQQEVVICGKVWQRARESEWGWESESESETCCRCLEDLMRGNETELQSTCNGEKVRRFGKLLITYKYDYHRCMTRTGECNLMIRTPHSYLGWLLSKIGGGILEVFHWSPSNEFAC
jgi:hypothetical protein